jgi:hypothetical protein
MVMVKLFAVMMLGSHAAETDGKRAVERRKEPHHNSGSDYRYDRYHGKEDRLFKGSHIANGNIGRACRKYAANVRPIIEEIMRAGATSPNAIAARLNERKRQDGALLAQRLLIHCKRQYSGHNGTSSSCQNQP